MSASMCPFLWLAADYHLPAAYSCRLPMSSANSAPASPAPGPATVRLALMRTGIEVLGMEDTRRLLFPSLCSMSVQIRPPARVAISPQILRAYKMEEESWGMQITEAPISREMAHADGPLTIYLWVPKAEAAMWQELLLAIGYWGQTSSLACCLRVEERVPSLQECIVPLRQWISRGPLQTFFSCILSEFRDASLTWEDLLPVVGTPSRSILRLEVYLWPLIVEEQRGSGKVLVRTLFPASSLS